MRLGLRAKLVGWFGGLLVPIVALLASVAITTAGVGRGFAEARAMDDLAQAVQQVLQWTTDYSLTWRPESLRTAEHWAKQYRETSRRFREQTGRPETATALDALDKGFDAYWAVATKMADGYINFDRIVGNSFTESFHSAARRMEEQVRELKEATRGRMLEALTKATRLAVIAAILIVAIVIAGALLTSSGLVRRIRAVVESLQDIAEGEGDLTKRLEIRSGDEIGEVARWFNTFVDKLHGVIAHVGSAAGSVATAAQQLSAGSVRMSSGAQKQASSLEETAAALEQLTATVKQAADSARQASQLALASRDTADRGGSVVVSAVSSMDEITRASKKIAEIITVIDDIAFQTNLLALNAAVEAARAGDQGRGFAVVAGEVRSLAQRSAAAAKQISGLIQDSVQKIQDGSALVNQSGQTLQDIVGSVKRVADIIGEIAAASEEQSHGIDQVNRAVGQMERITQTNAAQTEEVSTTAGGLTAEAEELRALVGRFKVDAAGSIEPPARPASDVGTPPSRPARRRRVRAPEPALAGVSDAFDRL